MFRLSLSNTEIIFQSTSIEIVAEEEVDGEAAEEPVDGERNIIIKYETILEKWSFPQQHKCIKNN